jgi:hypothetical protein
MPLLSYSATPSKGATVTVTLDKTLLLGLNAVGIDSFWSGGDDGDVTQAIVTLKSSPGNAKITLTFDISQATPTALLAIPQYARDVFQISKVAVIDTMGDKISIPRATLLSEIPTLTGSEIDLSADLVAPTVSLFQASKTATIDSSWVTSSLTVATQWTSIAWSPQLNLFVAVGQFPSTTGQYVATSPDGITWTSRTTPASTWNSVTWSPELNLFVAVGASGLNRVMRSSDGINWTSGSAASFNSWESVIWVSELNLFVAVGDGANPRAMTSPDGITWTSRTAPTNSWSSVTWSPSLSLLVAGGISGAVMTSPDGINWTSRTSGSIYNISSVAWSPNLSLFAAVLVNGSSTPIITSPDGINWTARSSPVSYSGNSIVWASGANRFISVGTSSGRHLVSSDGINWSQPYSGPITNSWREIVWSPQLGRAVAVSSDGTNRATTLSSSQELNFTVSAQDNVSSDLTLKYYSLPTSYSTVQGIETNGTLLDTKTVSNPAVNYATSVSSSTSATIFAVVAEDDSNNKGFSVDSV